MHFFTNQIINETSFIVNDKNQFIFIKLSKKFFFASLGILLMPLMFQSSLFKVIIERKKDKYGKQIEKIEEIEF